MAANGKSGSRRAVFMALVVAGGAAAGFYIGKDRFFGEGTRIGDMAGGVIGNKSDGRSGDRDDGGSDQTAYEPEIPAPDEIPVAEEPGAWAAEQAAYLETHAGEQGVSVTASGLQYRILSKSGQADKPSSTDIVQVHYRGQLTDGVEFDSSYNYGEPAEFPLNQVIPGWTEGVQLMSVGDVYEFTIPPALGYGARGAGDEIPGHSVLIFEVELLEIIRP